MGLASRKLFKVTYKDNYYLKLFSNVTIMDQ